MKSIERRFDDLQRKRPGLSSLTNFTGAVKGGRFSHDAIRRWFNKLVDPDDYEGVSKFDILRHLDSLSKPVRTTRIGDEFALTASPITGCIVQSV